MSHRHPRISDTAARPRAATASAVALGTAAILCGVLVSPVASAGPGPGTTPAAAPRGESDPIVIAVEAPLSGSQSANGKDMLRGVTLAVREVNARGGVLGRQVSLVPIDDRADASLAEASVAAAVAAGAVAVIGPYNSSVGVINLSSYMDAGIVPLRMTSADQTQGFGATTQPMVKQTSPTEVPYLASLAKTRVTMLVDPSAYTTSVAQRTAQGLRTRGIDVVMISIDADANDYTAAVSDALATNPDVIYSSTYYPEGAKIAQALAEANTTAACFMNLANVDTAFVAEAGIPVSRTCTFSGVPAAEQFPGAQAYVTRYIAAFGKQPDVWGSFTYDSALVLFAAMERAGTTRYSPLLKAVLGTTGLRGATGTITINPTSGNRRNAPMFILKVNRSGDFVIRT